MLFLNTGIYYDINVWPVSRIIKAILFTEVRLSIITWTNIRHAAISVRDSRHRGVRGGAK